MKKGKIVQISGPVIDVEFEDSDLPYIKDALEVDNDGKRCVMEVYGRCMLTVYDGNVVYAE